MIPPCEQAVRDAGARMRRVVTRGDLIELNDLVDCLRKAAAEAVVYNEGSDRTADMTLGERRRQVRACLARVLDYAGCLSDEIVALLRKAGAAEQSP
jgi:hypothetical protein